MSLIDRYLAREILLPFASGLLFLTQVLLATQVLSQAELLFGAGVSLLDVAVIIGAMLPRILGFVLPVAFLLGAVLGVARLAEDREVIALGAAGLSPSRLVRVPLALGILAAGLGLVLSLAVEPASLRVARLKLNDVVKSNLTKNVRAGTFFEDIPNFTMYAERVRGGELENVLISDRSNPSAAVLALARKGRLEPLSAGDEVRLVLENGELHREDAAAGEYAAASFQRGEVPVGLGAALSNRSSRGSGEFTVPELRRAAREAPNDDERRRLEAYLQRRIANPLAMVAFAILAVPLGATRRAGRAFGVVATFAGVVVQYLLLRGGEVLAQRAALPPVLALQLGNVFLVAAGIALVLRMERRGVGAVR